MLTCGKYKEVLEEPSLKAVIIHSQYVTSECYVISKFLSNVGPHKFIHEQNY